MIDSACRRLSKAEAVGVGSEIPGTLHKIYLLIPIYISCCVDGRHTVFIGVTFSTVYGLDWQAKKPGFESNNIKELLSPTN